MGIGNANLGDEAAVGINILDRDYRGLLQPLGYGQVAPIGFLWSERAVYQVLGMSELAMRLLPTLAGTAALFVPARWAKVVASPLAAVIAVGILAVGNYPVFRCVELKPYAGDLLASMALLYLATRYCAGWTGEMAGVAGRGGAGGDFYVVSGCVHGGGDCFGVVRHDSGFSQTQRRGDFGLLRCG